MTSRDFCYWLQGFFEISGAKEITPEQAQVIKNHLNMVFKHEIDPSMGNKEHQEALNKIHNVPTNLTCGLGPPEGGAFFDKNKDPLFRC
jgi:hypothetical protein